MFRAIMDDMGIGDALNQPDPVPIKVSSRASRELFAAELAHALSERRYSNPRGLDVFMRLRDGTVDSRHASFTVKTYLAPEIRSRGNIDKLVEGSFQDTETGSEFVGLVSTPISWVPIAFLGGWVAFLGLMAFLTGGPWALLAAAAVIFAPAVVAWSLILRYNQRANLREIGSLTRFLEAIATEAMGDLRHDKVNAVPNSPALTGA
jgi:hypothetical protein